MNVLNGTRPNFVERLRVNGSASVKKVPVPAVPAVPAATAGDQPKMKQRIPLPLFGLERQSFVSSEVVFTCVVGDRHLLEDVHGDSTHEHVLFSDRELPCTGWEKRPLLFWDLSPKLITLFHKYAMASLIEDGTKLLWVDSRVSVQPEVAASLFEQLDRTPLCLFRHHERQCVYDEVVAVLVANRALSWQCEAFSRHIRERAFPRNAGLFETGVMAFRVCPEIRSLFRSVFSLCARYAPRDQLALPLALEMGSVDPIVFNEGVTHLRNTPGIVVKRWQQSP